MSQVKLGWIQGQQTKWSIVEIKDFYDKDKSYILDIKPNYIYFGSHLFDFEGDRIFDGDKLVSENGQNYDIRYNDDDYQFYACSEGYSCILDQRTITFNKIRIIR